MEGGRRLRRFGIARGKSLTPLPNLLPLHSAASTTHFSSSVSCWYCDFKIFVFNNYIFHFGKRNASYLKVWFSIGVGFCVALMLGLALLLLLELGRILNVHNIYPELSKLLFGFFPTVSSLNISFADAGHVVFSTLLSVSVHEFGHAIAAASEDVQVEYIAVFMAALFPGALVAFNFEALHALPHLSGLRIYSAGIWHNAVTCAICGMTLLMLPVMLQPFYIHGQGLMVLEVPLSSPLYSYLSPGDVIVSLDGIPVLDQQDWIKATAMLDRVANLEADNSLHSGNIWDINNKKGYCVPTRILSTQSESIQFVDDPYTCPDDLTGFMSTSCSALGILDYRHGEGGNAERGEHSYCLNATEVVKFEKCGDGWLHEVTNGSSCMCTQDESCLIPIQVRGSTWVEVSYITPDFPECSEVDKVFPGSKLVERNCSGTFVYVGDFSAFSHTLELTAYRPRRVFSLGAYLPNFLEKILNCTYRVSLALALLNCLPVFFLDGESILEVSLGYFWHLSRRKRKQILNIILFSGTSISVLAFLRVITKDGTTSALGEFGGDLQVDSTETRTVKSRW